VQPDLSSNGPGVKSDVYICRDVWWLDAAGDRWAAEVRWSCWKWTAVCRACQLWPRNTGSPARSAEGQFLPRDALYCKARSCDRMSSVRPVYLSVCPSMTLVDHDHIGWKSWKLIARTISPTSSLVVVVISQKPLGRFRWNLVCWCTLALWIIRAIRIQTLKNSRW